MKSSHFSSHCVLILFLLSTCWSSPGADWPRFLGPNGDGTSPETGLISSWNQKDGVPILWTQAVGTGYAAPAVLGNRLVVHHRTGREERVDCLDATTGKTLWSHAYPSQYQDPFGYNNGPRCSPTLTTNRVYTYGAEGHLACLDMQTGKPVWTRETGKEWNVPEAFFGVGSTPLLHGNTLFVMVGGQPNAGVVALDASTGKTLWTAVGRDTWDGTPKIDWRGTPPVQWTGFEKIASYASPVLATLHGNPTLISLTRQGLVLQDPSNGEVLCHHWFRARINESVNAANPVILGNRIFFSSAYYGEGSVLIDINEGRRTYQRVWRDDVLEIHWSTPILHQGHLYAFSGRNEPDARFRCVEWETANLKWDRDESWAKYSTKTPDKYGRGSLILADGKLIALGEGGLLGLFEPSSSKPIERGRWQVPKLHYPCWAAPVLSNGRLFLRSEQWLTCLDFRDPARK